MYAIFINSNKITKVFFFSFQANEQYVELDSRNRWLATDHESLQRLHEQLTNDYDSLVKIHSSLKSHHKSLKVEHNSLKVVCILSLASLSFFILPFVSYINYFSKFCSVLKPCIINISFNNFIYVFPHF